MTPKALHNLVLALIPAFLFSTALLHPLLVQYIPLCTHCSPSQIHAFILTTPVLNAIPHIQFPEGNLLLNNPLRFISMFSPDLLKQNYHLSTLGVLLFENFYSEL